MGPKCFEVKRLTYAENLSDSDSSVLQCITVCVCEREGERERENACVYLYAFNYVFGEVDKGALPKPVDLL